MVEGFVDYRHPVQGWTMPLPVPDVENAPEVFYAKGTRMERADMAAPDRRDALALHTARALQKRMEPGAWELLRSDRREHFMALGVLVVDSLATEGALA